MIDWQTMAQSVADMLRAHQHRAAVRRTLVAGAAGLGGGFLTVAVVLQLCAAGLGNAMA